MTNLPESLQTISPVAGIFLPSLLPPGEKTCTKLLADQHNQNAGRPRSRHIGGFSAPTPQAG
jgi:hypothetical protein